MDIELSKVLLNTSLFILIWIVQLVIYPSFLYYSEFNINRWHSIYTNRISIIVLPLMLGQLLIYGYNFIIGWSVSEIWIAGLIIFNWIITFALAVPLHNKIQASNNSMHHRQKLVTLNWLRTIAWTFIFLISLTSYYAK